MMRYLTGSTSRGALCACALLAIGAAAPAIAQAPTLNLPPPAAPQAAPAPAPAPTGLSESVAQISWGRWIRGRYGSRLRIGEDQIAATQARLVAESAKPQYNIGEVLIDASRVGGMPQAMTGAQQLVAQMQQGAPFPSVARQFS